MIELLLDMRANKNVCLTEIFDLSFFSVQVPSLQSQVTMEELKMEKQSHWVNSRKLIQMIRKIHVSK